jgi:hypothetical protein
MAQWSTATITRDHTTLGGLWWSVLYQVDSKVCIYLLRLVNEAHQAVIVFLPFLKIREVEIIQRFRDTAIICTQHCKTNGITSLLMPHTCPV